MKIETATAETTQRPVSQRQLTVITLVLVLGAITTILDTTIVNIALNHLRIDFGAQVDDVQWIVTGYLLAYVAVIPVSGWASDRFGTRNVWMFAVGVFMVGSLLCGLAWSLPALVGFRILQGIGGGLVLPVTITVLTRAAGKERIGSAMAVIALLGQLGPILGPIIGGSIVEHLSWHWLFFVNLPFCLGALVAAPRVLPLGRREDPERFDTFGFALLTPGVAALAYGISQAADAGGFGATRVWGPLTVGTVLIAAFVLSSLRRPASALLDVRVFARRSFGVGSVVTFVGGFSLYALMFLLPLFYQQVRGQSPMSTGLLLIPQGLGTMSLVVAYKVLENKIDNRLVIAVGVVATMIGVLPFALADLAGGDVILLGGQFLQGFGMGAVALPVMALAFASLSHAETPDGSAAFSVVQRVGAPFGVTVVAVILQHFLAMAGSPRQILDAYTRTFWWILGLSVIPLLFAFFLPSSERLGGSDRAEQPHGHIGTDDPA